MQIPNEVFDLIFPKGIFEWFEIKQSQRLQDDTVTAITFEEKDLPPLTKEMEGKKILAHKFHDITITDFPIRGRRTLLTFRRRYWRIEGETKYLKRDIKLAFPGTQLELEFANFLKANGR